MKQKHGNEVQLLVVHLYSDETRVTNFGDTSAYPLHLSISNLLGHVRAKTGNSRWLLAYLPAPKALKTAQKSIRVKQRLTEIRNLALFHVLNPLKAMMDTPAQILCPDGISRSCVLRIAFWIADTPEKSKLMLTIGTSCNICMANENEGSFADVFPDCPLRSMSGTLKQWKRACKAYAAAPTHSKGYLAAKKKLAGVKINFCVVQPILHTFPDFSFASMAFDSMHTLEGKKPEIAFAIN